MTPEIQALLAKWCFRKMRDRTQDPETWRCDALCPPWPPPKCEGGRPDCPFLAELRHLIDAEEAKRER